MSTIPSSSASEILHILPAFFVGRPGCVGVRKLIDQHDFGSAGTAVRFEKADHHVGAATHTATNRTSSMVILEPGSG
jgi:hypothetical protein